MGLLRTLLCGLVMLTGGCSTLPPLEPVDHVDLQRFMGDWYVIAAIPTFIETESYNAVESYRLDEDGTVATTFRFRKGGFTGPVKTYQPRGFVRKDSGNAVWGMQFVWPFKAEYLIIHLDKDYATTVIGRSKRDYVWIMARTPQLPENIYQRIVEHLDTQGYDTTRIRKVPQQWPEQVQP